jgi:electron transport complex protein RnfE
MTMPNHPKRGSLLRGALTQNPVLVYAAGLTPVIIGTTYLRPAVWVTAVCVLHLFFCEALASSVLKRLPVWLRVAAYYALGLAIACPAAYLLTKSTWLPTLDDPALATVRFVMPLMATSGLAVVRCERYAVHNSVGDALHDAAESGLGFALVALVTGAVRELMGHGSLWGYEVSGQLRIRGFFMPFGGLLLLGAMAAALKLLLRHLSARGIARGADEKMEMEPEDRMERL